MQLENGYEHKQVFGHITAWSPISKACHTFHLIWIARNLCNFLHLEDQLTLLILLIFLSCPSFIEQSLYFEMKLLKKLRLLRSKVLQVVDGWVPGRFKAL